MKRFLKIARILLFLAVIPGMITTLVWANILSKKYTIQGTQYLSLSEGVRFVDHGDLDTLLSYYHFKQNETKVRNFPWAELENNLNTQEWIDSANVYVDANNQLHIVYKQRQPHVRIVEVDNPEGGYYLDGEGNRLELSDKFLVRVPVATLPLLAQNNLDKKVRQNLVAVSNQLMRDTFWRAACSQLDVKPNGEIQMVPVMGNQIIRLGDADDIENKLNRLTAFYNQGYQTVPWKLYNEIDARFQGQIIGRNTEGKILSVDPYDAASKKAMADTTTLNTINIKRK